MVEVFTNSQQITGFLAGFFNGCEGVVEFRALPSKGQAFFHRDDAADIAAWITGQDEDSRPPLPADELRQLLDNALRQPRPTPARPRMRRWPSGSPRSRSGPSGGPARCCGTSGILITKRRYEHDDSTREA